MVAFTRPIEWDEDSGGLELDVESMKGRETRCIGQGRSMEKGCEERFKAGGGRGRVTGVDVSLAMGRRLCSVRGLAGAVNREIRQSVQGISKCDLATYFNLCSSGQPIWIGSIPEYCRDVDWRGNIGGMVQMIVSVNCCGTRL